jgi:hypothetical protein
MSNLFELAQQYRADVAKLEDLELDDQTLSDTLESLSGDLELKAVNVIKFAKNLEATAAAIKEAEAAMAARRKSLEKRSDALRAYVFHNMQSSGIQKIECDYFRMAVRDNPPAVDIFDLAQLPQDYMREIPATYAPDKTLIKTAIKDGFVVPGAKLVTSQRLEIK